VSLKERAKALQTEVAKLVASPIGLVIPAQLRGLLGMQADFIVALAERVEALERKSGNG
jgi:hypothetical protein